jgi:hypothetical protein
MVRFIRTALGTMVLFGWVLSSWVPAETLDSFDKLGRDFTDMVSPILESHCITCHDAEVMEADLDLSRFASLDDVRHEPRVWQKVLRMLDDGQMPPKESRPLSEAQFQELRGWIRSYLDAEAHAGAGDPGRVVVRRLNNVEYNNAVLDLTGIDLQPARQFPPDSVSGEGFANTGDSLVMSPALLEKYIDAAREIASHAVLLRHGFRFSPTKTRQEWVNELLKPIRDIHERYTELYQERDAANVTRIQWGTVSLTEYVDAILRYRDVLQADAAAVDRAAVERIAVEENLNPYYLAHLAQLLSAEKPTLLLAKVQSQLKTAAVEDAGSIVDGIKNRQDQLFELKPIGQMFTKGLLPVDPLVESQTFRVEMQPQVGSDVVTLSLVASDAADGNEGDFVVWKNPRFESPGTTPLLLRDVRTYLARLGLFREWTLARTADYLAAAAESTTSLIEVANLADRETLDRNILRAWIDLLNLQPAREEFSSQASVPGRIVMFVGNDKDPRNCDAGIARYLRSRGHVVSFFVPGGKTAVEQHEVALKHDVVLISETIAAADVRFDSEKSLKDLPRPILSFEPYMYDDAGWTGDEFYKDFGHTVAQGAANAESGEPLDSLYISEVQHPVALGMKGKVKIYEKPYSGAYGLAGSAAAVIATVDQQGKLPGIFVYDQGDTLADGSVTPAARMGLFLGQPSAAVMNDEKLTDFKNLTFAGRHLLNAAIEYALDPAHVYQPGARELAENNNYARPVHYAEIKSLFTEKITKPFGHEALNGWAMQGGVPSIVANASGTEFRIPGYVRPHGVLVHPGRTHSVAVGWKSPIDGLVHIDASAVDAHPEGGNGQSWAVTIQQGAVRHQLAAGELDRGGSSSQQFKDVVVRKGDVVSLVIGPRDTDWACDGTGINLVISDQSTRLRTWDLAADISADIHAANPHPDHYGNQAVWHFFSDEVGKYEPTGSPLPSGSVLHRWRAAMSRGENKLAKQLAQQVTMLLRQGPLDSTGAEDRRLYKQVRSSTSPLFKRFDLQSLITRDDLPLEGTEKVDFGLPEAAFHLDAENQSAGSTNLHAQAPSVIRFELPADLVAGREFVVEAVLASPVTAEEKSGWEGSVQPQVVQNREVTANNQLDADQPVLVHKGSTGYERTKAIYDDFRNLFPRMMCCRTVVPLDSVVTIVQFHREDEYLSRLLLAPAERAELDRLWDELFFVSQDALRVHDSFPLFLEFATQDDPAVGSANKFQPLVEPIRQRAEQFEQQLLDAESRQRELLVDFAARAYRRPLAEAEVTEIQLLYQSLREQEVDHEEAFRAVLAGILVSPKFLYRTEVPVVGDQAGPVNDWELATRLSFFLWSTLPDAELRSVAEAKTLGDQEETRRQIRRMLQQDQVRNLATEFACQWLGLRDFDQHNEKNERQFPAFVDLRDDMYEEAVLFFTDLFQRDGSVLEILGAEHTFLNNALAAHYGIEGVEGDQWQRFGGIKEYSRGGILGMAALLSKQAGATRTSPVLRGNWVVETLLGEHLPDPPPTVPELPDAVSRDGLTVRELTEKHVSAPECANCHAKIDPFGFALESFDAIGQFREIDLVGKPVNTHAELPDGSQIAGIDGLRDYLLSQRREEFLRQFCRKLLGYSLGRAVQLTDEPLIEAMLENLKDHEYRFSIAVETIVSSKQFRTHRGLEATRVPHQ